MAKATETKTKNTNNANGDKVYSLTNSNFKGDTLDLGSLAGFKMLSRPAVLPLKVMPIGAWVRGVVVGIEKSYQKSIKNPLLILNIDGSRIAFPCQASIANTVLDGEPEDAKLKKGVLNHEIVIKKTATAVSDKWKDDNGDARQFAVYEIAVSEQPVK